MPFQKGDPRAAIAARKGQSIRWGKATPEDKAAANARMLAGQRAKAEAKAADTLSRLGLEATPETVQQAATALQKADQRERMARARDEGARQATALRSQSDAWNARVFKLVSIFIDRLCVQTFAESFPPLAQTIAKVAYMAFADETRLPVNERDYQRLRERLEKYAEFVHEQACPYIRPEGVVCMVCGHVGIGEVL